MKLNGDIRKIIDNMQILNYTEKFSREDAETVCELTDNSLFIGQLVAFGLGYMTAKHEIRNNNKHNGGNTCS